SAVVGTAYTRPDPLAKPDSQSGTWALAVRRAREASAAGNARTHHSRRIGPSQREMPASRLRAQGEARTAKNAKASGTKSQTNNLTYAVVFLSSALVLTGALCCTLLLNSEPSGFSIHRRADTTARQDRLVETRDVSPANIVGGTWSGVPADGDTPAQYGSLQADAL